MMIIWGTKPKIELVGHTKSERICHHCHNQSIWDVVEYRKYFTLFFIPIFPVTKKTIIRCPICETGAIFDKNHNQHMLDEINWI